MSLPEELEFSETDGEVNICASLQTSGLLQTELIVTLSIRDAGTAGYKFPLSILKVMCIRSLILCISFHSSEH